MKYATITGWKGDAGDKFNAKMAERIYGYENWDKTAAENEVFAHCEQQLTGGEVMDPGCFPIFYELSQFDTVSGHTELLLFSDNDFEIEWRDED